MDRCCYNNNMVVHTERPNVDENVVGIVRINSSDESSYDIRRPQTVHILTVMRRVPLESLPSHTHSISILFVKYIIL